jgi:hypothetical protein
MEIQIAKDMLCKGNINNASYQLQKVLYRVTEDADEIDRHNFIFLEAESFAQRCLDEMASGTFPEILM